FDRFRKYPDEVRGDFDEGGGAYETFSNEGTQNLIMTNTSSGSYMLCGSLFHDENVQQKFQVDSGIQIKDTIGFSNAILNAIPGTIEAFLGYCIYKDFRIVSKLITPFSDKDDLSPEGTVIIGGPNFNRRINETIGNGIDLMFLKDRKYQ